MKLTKKDLIKEIERLNQYNKTVIEHNVSMLQDVFFLQALKDAGVDNWEGYDTAVASESRFGSVNY